MNEDERKTPVDGFHLTGQKAHTLEEILETVHEVLNESRDIKLYSQRACESALAIAARIPQLEKEVARLRLFQAWFPTDAIAVAIIVRLIWLR